MRNSRERFSVLVSHKPQKFWRDFEAAVNSIVVGQERAVRKLVLSIKLLESGMQGVQTPPSPLLFVGPPGSGKTFLAQTIAKVWSQLWGDSSSLGGGVPGPLVEISGENLSREHEGSIFTGSPPGYVGYEDPSPLENIGAFDLALRMGDIRSIAKRIIEEVRKEYPNLENSTVTFGQSLMSFFDFLARYCESEDVMRDLFGKHVFLRSVLLVDEFEKIHPAVQKQFLGILNNGSLAMHNGREIDFRGCQIIFTGNIGTDLVTRELDGSGFGFQPRRSREKKSQDQRIYEVVRDEVLKQLDPALFSRIGHEGIVVFHALTPDDYARIIESEIRGVEAWVSGHGREGIALHATPAFCDFLLSLADTPREGARQVGRIVAKHVREPLSHMLDAQDLCEGDEILFDVKRDGNVAIRRTSRTTGRRRRPIRIRTQDGANQDIEDVLRAAIDRMLDRFFPDRDSAPRLPAGPRGDA